MAKSESEAVREAAEKLASGKFDNVAVQPATGGGYEVVVKQPAGPTVGETSWKQ
jgi:hypothetical protein